MSDEVLAVAGLTTDGAGHLRQPLTALTHPADSTRGDTGHERVVGNVAVDDGAGADEAVATKRRPADNRCIGANRCAATNERLPILVSARYVRAWVHDVGEHH